MMARWCRVLLLLVVTVVLMGAQAEDTTTEAADSTDARTDHQVPTRMTPPVNGTTGLPPILHEEANATTAAPNATEKGGKGGATTTTAASVVLVAVFGTWLMTLSAI